MSTVLQKYLRFYTSILSVYTKIIVITSSVLKALLKFKQYAATAKHIGI